ncbi:MAG: hypothetical protein HZC54_07090 [Verrucomicrobia bacterium]|nr:hypothetical protein [Verrucomicrobiota bacterium]
MKTRNWLSLVAITVIGLALGLTGIGWGLPSARRVALLGESVTKARAELNARTSRELNARRGHAAILAAQPAEEQLDLPRLVRRYLLFSDSPDEPLTLMALANMRPRQFDFNPRMVEYGGLHVYGTGAVMTLAHALGFGRIAGDVTHYADHPEHIAGLYIAGRLLMVLYNVGIAVLLFMFGRAVAAVSDRGSPEQNREQPAAGGRRYNADLLCGWAAALIWLLSPPSLAFSHIINPHLPAAFYATLAAWLAWRATDVPNLRCWLGASAASGAAAACALNAAASFLVVPAMAVFVAYTLEDRLKPELQQDGGWRAGLSLFARLCAAAARPLGLAALMAAAFYLALNPYCFANLDVLREELARFGQFRSPMLGVENVFMFCFGPLPHAIGTAGLGAALFGAATLWQSSAAGRALTGYAAAGLLLSAWLAGSDAGEALSIRFAMFVLPLLCLFGATALFGGWPRWARGGAAVIIATGCVVASVVYMASFTRTPRDDAGEFINRELPAGSTLAAPESPGPYEMPAFDFSRVRLVTNAKAPHEFAVRIEDHRKPATPAGFELAAGFPDARVQPPTPLSFSGRFARIYRKQISTKK